MVAVALKSNQVGDGFIVIQNSYTTKWGISGYFVIANEDMIHGKGIVKGCDSF